MPPKKRCTVPGPEDPKQNPRGYVFSIFNSRSFRSGSIDCGLFRCFAVALVDCISKGNIRKGAHFFSFSRISSLSEGTGKGVQGRTIARTRTSPILTLSVESICYSSRCRSRRRYLHPQEGRRGAKAMRATHPDRRRLTGRLRRRAPKEKPRPESINNPRAQPVRPSASRTWSASPSSA